jgi:hypothetical protein
MPAGVAIARPRAYLDVMGLFPRPSSPVAAIRDAFVVFTERRPHRAWMWAASVAIPALMFLAVNDQFSATKEYERPDIVYVQPWTADRPRELVAAQQARDLPAERATKQAAAAEQQRRRATFQKIDREMKRLGLAR